MIAKCQKSLVISGRWGSPQSNYSTVHKIYTRVELTWSVNGIRYRHFSILQVSIQFSGAYLGRVVKCSPKMAFKLKTAREWGRVNNFCEECFEYIVLYYPATCSDKAIAYLFAITQAIRSECYLFYRLASNILNAHQAWDM